MKIIKTSTFKQSQQRRRWDKVPGSTEVESYMEELRSKLGEASVPIQNEISAAFSGAAPEQLDAYNFEFELEFESSGYYEPARLTADPYYSSPAEGDDERIVTGITINVYTPQGETIGSVGVNPEFNSYFQHAFEREISEIELDTDDSRPEDY